MAPCAFVFIRSREEEGLPVSAEVKDRVIRARAELQTQISSTSADIGHTGKLVRPLVKRLNASVAHLRKSH